MDNQHEFIELVRKLAVEFIQPGVMQPSDTCMDLSNSVTEHLLSSKEAITIMLSQRGGPLDTREMLELEYMEFAETLSMNACWQLTTVTIDLDRWPSNQKDLRILTNCARRLNLAVIAYICATGDEMFPIEGDPAVWRAFRDFWINNWGTPVG